MPIQQLIYMSKGSDQLTKDDILAILDTARKYNRINGITGVLMFRGGQFLQLLEGEPSALKRTYDRIRLDRRHSDLITIVENRVEKRLFEHWSMAYGAELFSEKEVPVLFENLDQAMHSPELNQRVIMSILESFAHGAREQKTIS